MFLNFNKLITMHGVREKLKASQTDYNHYRPHGRDLAPSEFTTGRSGQLKEAANFWCKAVRFLWR